MRSEGLTFKEISQLTGSSQSSAHRALKRYPDGEALVSLLPKKLRNGSTSYGYCLFQGKLVPDPREQKIIQVILGRWKCGVRYSAIAKELNEQKLVTKTGKAWSYFAVRSVIQRHLQESNSKNQNDGDET